jgi:cytochrome c biogenesis protein
VTDVAGQTLFQSGVPLLWASSDDTKSIGQLELPNSTLTIYVIGVASGRVDSVIKPGQMKLEIYDGSNFASPVAMQVISQGQPATLAGLNFTFERERQYTGLIVARDPGAPFVWLGALLLVAGVGLVFFFPVRRIWARVRQTDGGAVIDIAAASRHDISFRTAFRSLIDRIELALSGASEDR